MIVALSFDSATFPIVSLDFSPLQEKKTYKLLCKGYDTIGRNVIKTKIDVTEENHPILWRNEAQPGLPQTGGILYQAKYLKLFSLNQKITEYSLNNRDWIFVLNLLDPKKPFNKALFPLIETKKAYTNAVDFYTAWFLEQINLRKINNLIELSWENLYELLQKINAENPCTIFISDGQDLVVYQGSHFAPGVYYLRSCPPHNNNPEFKSGIMKFQLDALDLNHTMVMISTEFIAHPDAKFFNLNQMMVIRSGEVIWNKDPQEFLAKPELPVEAPFEIPMIEPQNSIHKISATKIPCLGKKNVSFLIGTEWDAEPPVLYSLIHETTYEYESPIYLSTHLLRLQPVSDIMQTLLNYELTITADETAITNKASNFMGAFGNHATFIEIKQPYKKLKVLSQSIVSVTVPSKERYNLLHVQQTIPLIWMPWDRIMMQAYLVPSELPESQLRVLSDYALTFIKRNNNDLSDILNDINRTIYEDYIYVPGSTTLETTPFDVYVNHKGVCQDFANLFICLARLLNIPARYRTGYIYTAKNYDNTEQGDASHAWLEVFLPLVGWTGYDPTNYSRAEENHIRVACGRTYLDTAPTSGTIYRGGGGEKLTTNVKLKRLDELNPKDIDINVRTRK